ncbi:hypothetical protein B0F90DRAFT_1765254 [Multifurca ochricompacta]|uniref:Uncharacterized protein n=1 Tax=Multifurca ochricompacta TaxID=376703 RepID=A0AAD4QG75_9AGAM|nr:hypothetical protein B0F90DRAFT_1765254 [Multifurca ochricompacta]
MHLCLIVYQFVRRYMIGNNIYFLASPVSLKDNCASFFSDHHHLLELVPQIARIAGF